MKFRVDRDVLAEAVTWTARTLPVRPASPVLSGVKITAEQGILQLATFDFEVSARCEVAADVDVEGSVLVSGRLLADIARALPAQPVSVALDGNKVLVTCGASKFTLTTMPVDEYPALPQMPETSGTIDAQAFTQAVTQVTVAASKDNTLPLLTGVRVEIQGEKITLLATDRYRLALRELTWKPNQPDAEQVALVPMKTLSDVAKTMASSSQISVALSTGGGKELIGFEAGGRHTTSQLLDGDYPHVRRLFPDSSPIHAVVSRQDLVEATRRVALVAERNTPIRLSFTDGQVLLDAGQGDDAQASEVLDAVLEGEEISVAFNPQYLLDGLTAIDTEFVRLAFTQPSKPVEFTGQTKIDGEDDLNFRYLLVPIRFSS